MRWILIFGMNILVCICAGIQGLLVTIASVLITYATGILLEKSTKYRKLICLIYIVLQICLLFGCKYDWFNIVAPLAISFFTLTSIGYVVDVYRGKYTAVKNPLKLMTVISFFPLMIQGPVCRYDEIAKQIDDGRINYEDFTYGLTRIAYGAMKKLVIADRLGLVFDGLLAYGYDGTAIAANILVYAFYLYMDFSGGIDIAVGIGYLFGIKLPENFNRPFISVSIADYWRRWHMSLCGWMRDYVFYPVSFSKPVVKLGKLLRQKAGNKVAKKLPVYVATLLVWFVTGIWHGINLNFIVWGMLNAVIMLISYELEPLYVKFNNRFTFTKTKAYNVFRVLRTFMLMGVLRMLDYTTVLGFFKSLTMIVSDFRMGSLLDGSIIIKGIERPDYIVIIIGILLVLLIEKFSDKKGYKKLIFDKGTVLSYSMIAIMVLIVIIFGMYGIGYEGKDFIYSRY